LPRRGNQGTKGGAMVLPEVAATATDATKGVPVEGVNPTTEGLRSHMSQSQWFQNAKAAAAALPTVREVRLDHDEPQPPGDWWDQISDEDREYLLGPPKPGPGATVEEIVRRRQWEQDRHPGPCFFCGGRTTHSKLCREQKDDWEPRVTFGRYKGRRVSEVPQDYLPWLYRHSHNEDVKAAIRERVSRTQETSGDTPLNSDVRTTQDRVANHAYTKTPPVDKKVRARA
jgi:hypothetical protein